MDSAENRDPGLIIPDAESRCVWMDAGVISLKICDRDFDCDRCPLDRALRGEGRDPIERCAGQGERSEVEPLTSLALDTGLHYHPGHTRIRVENPGLVRVGLDPLLTSVLGQVDAVCTRRQNEELVRGAALGEIIQVDRCFPVLSPVSGRVVETNQEVAASPGLAMADPLRRGWLLTVEPSDLEADLALCRTGKAVLSWTMKRMDWVNACLAPVLERHNSGLGVTMFDGGQLVGNLKELMPQDEYRRLVLGLLGDRDDWET